MATKTSLLGLTKPDYSENQDIGVINTNMDIIDREIGKRSRAYNLLDNSDFEIAQAGYGGKHGTVIYAADRWPQNDSTARTYSKVIHNGHGALQCTSATRIQQKFTVVSGEDYTAAVIINGILYILNFNADGAGHGHRSGQLYLNYINANTYMFVMPNLAANVVVSEPVVYRGTYTAETLPTYVPNRYAAELAECKRHYQQIIIGNGFLQLCGFGTTSARGLVPITGMRAIPTVNSDKTIRLYDGTNYISTTGISISAMSETAMCLNVSATVVPGTVYTLYPSEIAVISFSADL